MFIFLAITIVGLILLVGSLIFGGHDHDGEVGHDHDGDGHLDHGEPTISVFSTKVIGAFLMMFGAGGAVFRYYNQDWMISSVGGFIPGFIAGAIVFFGLRIIYKQQGSSTISLADTIGKMGNVVTAIRPHAIGEVELSVKEQTSVFLARGEDPGTLFQRGARITVVGVSGTELVVKPNQ